MCVQEALAFRSAPLGLLCPVSHSGKGKGERKREVTEMQNLLPGAQFRPDYRACLGELQSRFAVRFSGPQVFVSADTGEEGELTLETERQMRGGLHVSALATGQNSSVWICKGVRGEGRDQGSSRSQGTTSRGRRALLCTWKKPPRFLSAAPGARSRSATLCDTHLPQFLI